MTMSFMPQQFDAESGYCASVFSLAETEEYLWPDPAPDADPVENPAYRPEFDMALSNFNALDLLDLLGLVAEDGLATAPIGDFVARCEAWLRGRKEMPTTSVPMLAEDGSAHRAVTMGDRAAYFVRQIERALTLARAGRARGAETMVVA